MRELLDQEVLINLLKLTSRSKTLIKQLEALNDAISDTLVKGRYLEIGAFEGRSLAMYSALTSFKQFKEPAFITCIDNWTGGDEHKVAKTEFMEVEKVFDQVSQICLDFLPKGSEIEKLKGLSKHSLSSIISRSKFYDLILVDGGHKSKEVILDLVLSWELLRDGGILIIDDYTWIPKHLTNKDFLINSPKLGVDSFINCFSDELVLISNQPLLQLYIKKQSPASLIGMGSHCLAIEQKSLPSLFDSIYHLL